MAEEKDLKQEETKVQDPTGPNEPANDAPQEGEPQYEALLGAFVLVGLNGQDIKVIDAKEVFPEKVAQELNAAAMSKLMQDTGKRFEREEIVKEVQAAMAQKMMSQLQGGQQ